MRKVPTCEQSRKFHVHGKDIQKFGKIPSLTTRLHKNDVWLTWVVSLKGKFRTVMMQPSKGQRGQRCFERSHRLHVFFDDFQKPMSIPYMFSIAGNFPTRQVRTSRFQQRCDASSATASAFSFSSSFPPLPAARRDCGHQQIRAISRALDAWTRTLYRELWMQWATPGPAQRMSE